jgi:hypothetical protein
MGYPDNSAFMVAGYTVAAVILLVYWISLVGRTRQLK